MRRFDSKFTATAALDEAFQDVDRAAGPSAGSARRNFRAVLVMAMIAKAGADYDLA
jgi:hypothetical protein